MNPDPQKETEHLDKHEEVASQFDYSYSQVNEMDHSQPPAQPITPPTNQPNTVRPPLLGLSPRPMVDAKILRPKYLLIYVAISVIYYLLTLVISIQLLSQIIFPIFMIIIGLTVRSLRAKGKDELTESDKVKMITLMSIDPIIGQALYYYSLKKVMPDSARIALKVGWKVFWLTLLYVVIFVAIGISQLWIVNNGQVFKENTDAIVADLNAISAAAQSQDGPLLKEKCQKLATDVTKTKEIPKYPDEQTQIQFTKSLDTLTEGANNCASAIDQDDLDLMKRARSELTAGYDDLKKAAAKMN